MQIIERSEVGYQHGSGWGTRPLPATEVFIHYPGAKAPPPASATLEEDLAYARYLDEIGYGRFKDADLTAEGIDAWPGEPGAGISYSLIFPKSGRIIRGHDPQRQSSHTKGHNYQGMGYVVLISEGEQANQAQLDAIVWAAHEQARRGELAVPVITGGHRDVVATLCPTDNLYAQIPALKARVQGGVMARRRPVRRDFDLLVQNQAARGFEHYCTPRLFDLGICPSHGGTNPHTATSRHRKGLAVDFGWPGPPVGDLERIHVLLEMRRLDADPEIDWRMLFNISDTNHPDHGHVDDGLAPGENYDVWKDRQGVLAKDGVTLFVSPRAFPNHIPPMNADGRLTLAQGVEVQKLMGQLINPKTGQPFFSGLADGYIGQRSRAAATEVQRFLGIEADGIPGAGTRAAIRAALSTPPPPPPAPPVVPPVSTPSLAERVAPYRLGGGNAASTARIAGTATLPTGRGVVVYNRGSISDGLAALHLAVRAGAGTLALPINADHSVPSAVRTHAAGATWVRAVGGSSVVSDQALSTVLSAAGINH